MALCSGAGSYTKMRALRWAVESLRLIFFLFSVIQPLCELIEGYMVRILVGKFFVLEASSFCNNVVPQLKRNEHDTVLCLLDIMQVINLDDATEGVLWR